MIQIITCSEKNDTVTGHKSNTKLVHTSLLASEGRSEIVVYIECGSVHPLYQTICWSVLAVLQTAPSQPHRRLEQVLSITARIGHSGSHPCNDNQEQLVYMRSEGVRNNQDTIMTSRLYHP